MKELIIKGIQEFMGKEIPVIEGGFGEGQKVVLAKTIAEIHGVELKEINKLINNNIDEFEFDIDILDLSLEVINNQSVKDLLLSAGYTNRGITATLNQEGKFYLLSEQGYHALVSIMKTPKAKEIRKQLRREYFAMREVINSKDQLRANLLLSIYNGGQAGIIASHKLAELEVEEAMKPLVETIQVLSPMAEKYNIFIDNEGLTDVNSLAKNLAIKNLGRNNFYKYLRSKGLLQKDNCPYQRYVNDELFVLKPAGSYIVGEDTIQNYKTYITTKGVNKIIDMLIEDQYLAS